MRQKKGLVVATSCSQVICCAKALRNYFDRALIQCVSSWHDYNAAASMKTLQEKQNKRKAAMITNRTANNKNTDRRNSAQGISC